MTEAIDTDVEVTEKEIGPESIDIMDDIAKRNREAREKDTDDDPSIAAGYTDEEEPEEEPDEPDLDEPEDEEEPDEELVEINAAGEKHQVPMSKVIESGKATLQKETTADQRLAKATEAFKLLQQRAAELDALEEKLNKRQKTSATGDLDEVVNKYSEGILDGDEETATEFIKQTMEKVNEADQKIGNLEAQLQENRAFIEHQRQEQKAELSKLYAEEYSDISGDNNLHMLAQQKAAAIRAANPDLPEKAVMEQSCNEVRDWVDSNFASPEMIKKDMPKQPKKAAGRVPPKPKPKRKTASDIINEIKASRGVLIG